MLDENEVINRIRELEHNQAKITNLLDEVASGIKTDRESILLLFQGFEKIKTDLESLGIYVKRRS